MIQQKKKTWEKKFQNLLMGKFYEKYIARQGCQKSKTYFSKQVKTFLTLGVIWKFGSFPYQYFKTERSWWQPPKLFLLDWKLKFDIATRHTVILISDCDKWTNTSNLMMFVNCNKTHCQSTYPVQEIFSQSLFGLHHLQHVLVGGSGHLKGQLIGQCCHLANLQTKLKRNFSIL